MKICQMKTYSLAMLLITAAYSQSCSSSIPVVNLYLTNQETYQWDLSSLITGSNLDYKLSDESDFTIIPFAQTTDTSVPYSNDQISIKATAINAINGYWTQNIAFLSQPSQGQATIEYAKGVSQKARSSPKFDASTLLTGLGNIQCLNLDYISQNHVVVDCFDTNSFQNYFYIVKLYDLGAPTQVQSQNVLGYKVVSNRIIRTFSYPTIGSKVVTYLFRGVPYKQGDKTFINKSAIEVFGFDDNNKPYFTGNILDGATLAAISQSKSKDTSFNLVDFKITPDGYIYVLDSSMKLYKLKYNADGTWSFYGLIEVVRATPLAFDIFPTSQSSITGTSVTRIAVLFLDYYVVYDWADGEATFQSQTLTELGFKAYNVGQFQISDSLIFVEDTDKQLLYAFEGGLNTRKSVQFPTSTYLLVNQKYDLAVTLTNSASQAWAFQAPELNFKRTTTTKAATTITLSATAQDQTSCSTTINYTIVDGNDWNIYENVPKSSAFPAVVTYPNTQRTPLNGIANGPNLIYQSLTSQEKVGFLEELEASATTIQVFELWQLKTPKDTKFPTADKIVFTQMLSSNDNPLLYNQAVQTTDLALTLWECKVQDGTLPSDQASCESNGSVQLNQQLNSQMFQIWGFNDQITLAIQDSDFSVGLYICDDNNCSRVIEFAYEKREGNQIGSFFFQDTYMWILRPQPRTIDIFSAFGELFETINIGSLQSLGFDQDFVPLRLYANRESRRNIVFIHNTRNLLLLDYTSSTVHLYSTIEFGQNQKKNEVEIGANKKTFFLAKVQQDKASFLQEFNYESLTNVYLQKDVNLYWYQYQGIMQSATSDASGFFFIRALCVKCNKTFVLVFRPNVQERNSLFKAIYTDALIADDQSLLFAANGKSNYYLYLNLGTQQSTWTFLDQPFMFINQQVQGDALIQVSTLALTIKNYDFPGNNKIEYSQKVKVYNTQTNVVINQQKNALLKFNNSNTTQSIDLEDALQYSGQVISFSAVCDDCPKNIHVINRVESVASPFSYSQASDFATWGSQLLVQTPNKIYFTQKNQLSTPFVTLPKPSNDFVCSLISPSDDNTFLVSLCQDSNNYYAYITSCLPQTECHPVDYILLPGVTRASKFALVGTTVFVMNTNWQNTQDVVGSLKVFELSLTQDDWIATQTYDFNSTFFGKATNIVDFDMVDVVISATVTVTRLYLIDAQGGFLLVDGTLANGKYTFKQGSVVQDLVTFLNSDQVGQITSPFTQFLSAKIYSSDFQAKTNLLTQKVLLTTSDVAHYAFIITYDTTDPAKIATKSLAIDFIVNRYQWPTLNKLKVSGKTIAIPYLNLTTNEVLVALYKLPTVTQLGAAPQVVLMSGGSILPLSSGQINNFALKYQVGDDTQLLTNGEALLQLNDKLALAVNNGTGLKSQKLQLVADNGFSKVTFDTEITNESDEEESSKGWKWWYTLLIILGVLLVAGVIAFVVIKNRKQKTGDYATLEGNSHVQIGGGTSVRSQ